MQSNRSSATPSSPDGKLSPGEVLSSQRGDVEPVVRAVLTAPMWPRYARRTRQGPRPDEHVGWLPYEDKIRSVEGPGAGGGGPFKAAGRSSSEADRLRTSDSIDEHHGTYDHPVTASNIQGCSYKVHARLICLLQEAIHVEQLLVDRNTT